MQALGSSGGGRGGGGGEGGGGGSSPVGFDAAAYNTARIRLDAQVRLKGADEASSSLEGSPLIPTIQSHAWAYMNNGDHGGGLMGACDAPLDM